MTAPQALWTSMVPADATFTPGQIAVAATGNRVAFADGSTKLCATSGLWNVPLGFGNPAVDEAVARAAHDASYLSLFRAPHRFAQHAAEALIDLAGTDRYSRVVFSTSGGAANDATMKLARQYWAQQGAGSRSIVVGLRGSYHGTMYGSHSLSGDDLLQQVYSVDRRAVRHVSPHDDGAELDTLLAREGTRVAAVVVEPVLGSGAHVLSDAFVTRLLALRERHGFLLVADEVATGFGRTGSMFASDRWDAAPDVLVLSKALTNGATAAAALLVGPRIAHAFARGGWTFVHGETQAGTPASAAAVLAVIEELQRIDTASTVRALAHGLAALASKLRADGLVSAVTGRGCFVGLGLQDGGGGAVGAAAVMRLVAAIASHGVLVQPGPSAIQLIPAYGFGADELLAVDAAVRAGLAQTEESRA